MLGQHVQSDVLCEGRLGFRLRLWRPLSRRDAHQLVPLNLEVTPAIGRPHRVMEVGGHLYVVIQPAGAPPLWLWIGCWPVSSGSIWMMVIFNSPLISKLWRSSNIQFQMH